MFEERKNKSEFDEIRKIEDEFLAFKKENLKVYVVAAGVPYGNGETVFNQHFHDAWLQTPKRLPYVGEGENLVPTIHISDLARLVKKIADSKPDIPYILAMDLTEDRQQRSII